MQREIDMDMIIVKDIGAGAKHRRELAASAGMDVLQESPRLLVAPGPITDDRNLAPIRETKTANVESVAKSMFGNASTRLVVHRPAAIGAHRIDFDHRLTETRPRGRLHDLAQPRIERGDHRAVERINRVEAYRAIEQCARLEGPGQAANTRAVNFAGRPDIGRDMDEFMGETGGFRLAAPRRPARPLVIRAAGQRQHQGPRNRQWQKATRHWQDMRAIS